eukprot:2342620-Lingulodinium_polyedra.AAC.1
MGTNVASKAGSTEPDSLRSAKASLRSTQPPRAQDNERTAVLLIVLSSASDTPIAAQPQDWA